MNTIVQSQLELLESLLILSAQTNNVETADEQYLQLKIEGHDSSDPVKIIKIIL